MAWSVDRQKAMDVFQEYTSRYNPENDMIRLKVEHTYRVAELCERIAQSLQLSQRDVDLAWLIGLLHDIGRFEQQRIYHTFNDAASIDHAKYGADILFVEGRIREFLEDAGEDRVIGNAIVFHSAYRLPEGLDERSKMFANIIRDADKIDILRVNVEFPLEEIYNVSKEEMYSGRVTPEVMESFCEGHAVLRSLKKTAVDNVVGHISLTYELVYPISHKIVKEQGYLEQLMGFESWDPDTREQFYQIRQQMRAYLEG